MPTLNWIGKEKVINHHMDVPYRVLEHKYGFRNGFEDKTETASGNKIIHGDNLEALKSLLPEYEGKIKCIYIDPPYNTGAENWCYNDNVNDPKIKKWLGQVVGKESEDLSRHDKWLCMFYPRLKLLYKLLTEDGIIFINIDDNELHNLILIMDEIFGIKNRIATLCWDLGSGTSAGHFTRAHEYIVVYTRNKTLIENFSGGSGVIDDRALKKIGNKNPASDFTFPAGVKLDAMEDYEFTGTWGDNETITLVNGKMVFKEGKLLEPVTLKAGWTQKKQMESWFNGEDTVDSKGQKIMEFYFRKNGKLYCRKQRDKINPPTVIRNIASSKTATQELEEIFGASAFNYPKPVQLIKFLVSLILTKDDIVLDSFAGSGTTAHAVLELNKEDGGNRKFICIEMEHYAETITAERVKRVINGYGAKEGAGGSFDFYELGQPLFNGENEINELIGIEKLREYIYYTETRRHLGVQDENVKDNEYFLGYVNDTSYYFYYEQDSPTHLDFSFLSTIKNKAEQYIIYADVCFLSKEFMTKHKIIFKKIPRDITKF